MDIRTWDCPSCDDVRDFVQPGCVDGHTADAGGCPEWACSACGCAVVVGVVPGPWPGVEQLPQRLAA